MFAVGLGGDDLRGFSSTWDSACKSEQRRKARRRRLGTLLIRQIRKSKCMEVDVAHYARLPPDHADRCYKYLHRCVNATIEKDRLAWTLTEATRSTCVEHETAAAGAVKGDKGGQKSGKYGEKGKGKCKGDKKGDRDSASGPFSGLGGVDR